jgi:uncharacterized membrane protein
MNKRTKKLVMAALIAALACVATMIIKIPSPLKGYLNLGDCVVLVAGWMLSPAYGFLAAGLGSALADILSAYIIYAPATFVIKGVMAFIMGLIINFATKNKELTKTKKTVVEVVGMVAAGAFMTVGYYVAEGIMYGNWVTAALGIPWNIGQAIAGVIIAVVIAQALRKSSAAKFFVYK